MTATNHARDAIDASSATTLRTPGIDTAQPVIIIATPEEDPELFRLYCQGLAARYIEIGAGHLATNDHTPRADETRAVVLMFEDGVAVAGVRIAYGTDLDQYEGLEMLAAPITERAFEGVNEIKGIWTNPSLAKRGFATALLKAALAEAETYGARWAIGFANERCIGPSLKAGLVRDERFTNVPFPSADNASTLVWFDFFANRVVQ